MNLLSCRSAGVFMILFVLCLGCARPLLRPSRTSFYEFTVPNSRAEVFDAALMVAQDLNLNVMVLEKESGLIRFGSAVLTADQLDIYCQYPYVHPRSGESVQTYARWNQRAAFSVRGNVSLTVLVSETPGSATGVSVRGNWTATGGIEAYTVNSKGVFEEQFKQSLLVELANPTRGRQSTDDSVEERLQELERLRDDGLIDPADYDRKRGEILQDL